MSGAGERTNRAVRHRAGRLRARPPKVRVQERAQAMEGLALASAKAGEMAQRTRPALLTASTVITPAPQRDVAPLAESTSPVAQAAKPEATRSAQGTTRSGRVLALDGLRGVGIAAVVAYHLNPTWLPGGYLGVDIFFVVSGFLITGILLDLLAGPSSLPEKLRNFWARRVRRLFPALVALCFFVTVAAALFAHDAVPRLRADIPAALGFVANWRLLFHHDSYFELMGRPPLLLHLWSLGVEEQFYLIWPWVVLLVVRFTRRPARSLAWVAGAGALASASAMGLLFVPGHDPSNVYYNTFTHSAGLMIGAALVAGLRAGRERGTKDRAVLDLAEAPATHAVARRFANVVGLSATAGLAVLLVVAGDEATFSYRGGIFLASALVACVIWASLLPGLVSRLFSVPLLRYLGARSYSLYLWHWPVIVLTRPDLDVPLSGAPLLALRLAIMGALAEVSYRFVEQPFRTGQAQAALRAMRRRAKEVAIGSAGLAGAGAVALLVLVNPPALPAILAEGSTQAARATLPSASVAVPGRRYQAVKDKSRAKVLAPTADKVSGPAAPKAPASTAGKVPATHQSVRTPPRALGAAGNGHVQPPQPSAPPSSAPSDARTGAVSGSPAIAPSTTTAANPLGHDVLAIGDSVLLAASQALSAKLDGDITVDAAVGRQCWSGIERLAQYRAAGDLVGLKAIIIDLGTNGPMTPSDVAQVRALAAGVPLLIFVNVRVDRPWQSETNASLAAVANQPGVRVVNWYAASAAPGLLWPDGVHPDPAGATVYANLVAAALGNRH
ncbi:MAG: acyltransferase family protein [Acidimicrobiales bacterium]